MRPNYQCKYYAMQNINKISLENENNANIDIDTEKSCISTLKMSKLWNDDEGRAIISDLVNQRLTDTREGAFFGAKRQKWSLRLPQGFTLVLGLLPWIIFAFGMMISMAKSSERGYLIKNAQVTCWIGLDPWSSIVLF